MEKNANAAHGIVYRREGPFSYCGWPTVCSGEGEELFAVCSGHRVGHVCPFGKTYFFKSPDGGKTWSPPSIINDTPLDDRDAGILYMGAGRLLVTWFVHPAKLYLDNRSNWFIDGVPMGELPITAAALSGWRANYMDPALAGSFIRISENNGLTWGETIRIPVSAPHGPALLSDGSLLYLGKEMYSDLEEEEAIAAYRSLDGGHTWNRQGGVGVPEGLSKSHFHEPHAVETASGRILGVIRAQGEGVYKKFTMYSCFSDDLGKTWTEPKPLNVSGSPPHLLRHSSGAIICSFGRRESPFGERALVSRDDGESFAEEYIIFDGAKSSDLGYPATAELPDGSLVTVYYQKYGDDRHASLLCSRWRL